MKNIGTSKCLACGNKAIMWAGHVIGRKRMVFGNFADVKVGAGWCSEECHDSLKADDNGCFGRLNLPKHGPVKNIFKTEVKE